MFPTHSRVHAALPRVGRCFRTALDGRIALTRDWRHLLRTLAHVGPCALQTRHHGARLVTRLDPATCGPGIANGLLANATGAVHGRLPQWSHAWGFLRTCDCCASPGRIEVHNAAGGDFLQFCAPPHGDGHAWSDALAALVGDDLVPAAAPPVGCPFALLRLGRAHVRLPFDLTGLATLLRAFGDESLPVRCTLRTADVCHRRDLVPRRVDVDASLLTLGSPGASAQVALLFVRALALTSDAAGAALHLVDADDDILLTFSAAIDPFAASAWHGALRLAFPGLR